MNIALLGLGTVGKGVYDIIKNDLPGFNITHVLVKHLKKHDEDAPFATSFDAIVQDRAVDVVIEVMGGIDVAYDCIKRSLLHGKHVITANKAVVFAHFDELSELAKEQGLIFRYEASVCAAMILLDPLNAVATYNRITKIEGILNGSTNFILSKMFRDGMGFDEAYERAKINGYIESDSDDDMNGNDAMRKLGILSSIAFQTIIGEEDIIRVPLSHLSQAFYDYVKHQGKMICYVGTAVKEEDRLMIYVAPVIVGPDHRFASVDDEMNMVVLEGVYHDTMSFSGQGAGGYPTASAVIYDLLKVAEGRDYPVLRDHRYLIDRDMVTYRFLVEKNGVFTTIGPTSFDTVMLDETITCFARVLNGCSDENDLKKDIA